MPGEPGALVLTIFDQLIDRIKSARPVRTNGQPLTTGFVYSQLVLGMPIDSRDFKDPWSPMGGSTLQEAVAAAAPAPAGGGPAPAGGATATAPNPAFRKAMEAAFKTSQLVDRAIMVTNDDSYLEYPTTRHISFAYENIINGMQPTPMPPIAPEVQKQIDDARKVLYEIDEDGDTIGKSKRYKRYLENAKAVAKAKMDYADAQAAALADSTKADAWPTDEAFYRQQWDEAWDTFKTEGAEKVERALDVLASVGVSLQDRMIAKSRKNYDAWNLGLAGVPVALPYSFVLPTAWCDTSRDDVGWQKLEVTRSTYSSNEHSSSSGHSSTRFTHDSSSTRAGGSVFLGFIGLGGGGSSSSSDETWRSHWDFSAESDFHNDATDLSITLEYALCTIERPWLLGDLFYMKNWYLVNNLKNAISDGSIEGQAKDEKPLLPMIPTQFLAIRNVQIKSQHWGSDGGWLTSFYSDHASDWHARSAGGAGGVSLGFINFGAAHSESHVTSGTDGTWGHDAAGYYNSHFDGETLSVNGTQIIAWLSEVVPATAPLDDPGLT